MKKFNRYCPIEKFEKKTIKRKILKSASNEKNILNINCLLNQHRLKEITKIGENKYIHRGSWKVEFKKDMIRKYNIFPK